jgi:hypothetical protein
MSWNLVLSKNCLSSCIWERRCVLYVVLQSQFQNNRCLRIFLAYVKWCHLIGWCSLVNTMIVQSFKADQNGREVWSKNERSIAGIVSWIPTRGMNVCVRLLGLWLPACRLKRCDGLLPRSGSPFWLCIESRNRKKKMWPRSDRVDYNKKNSTIPTERSPLVGEVSANLLRIKGCRVVSKMDPYGRILAFLDRNSYFFLSSSSSIILTRLAGPCSTPTTS